MRVKSPVEQYINEFDHDSARAGTPPGCARARARRLTGGGAGANPNEQIVRVQRHRHHVGVLAPGCDMPSAIIAGGSADLAKLRVDGASHHDPSNASAENSPELATLPKAMSPDALLRVCADSSRDVPKVIPVPAHRH